MSKKRILIVLDKPLEGAPRAQNMIRALRNEFSVTLAAPARDDFDGYEFERLEAKPNKSINFHFGYPLPLRKAISGVLRIVDKIVSVFPDYYMEKKYWTVTNTNWFEQLKVKDYDAVLVHHVWNLPLGHRLAQERLVPLFLNAHEYYPRQFDNDLEWIKKLQPLMKFICKKYLKHVKQTFCASEGFAAAYKENYGSDSVIVPCTKPYVELKPKPTGENIKIVHQGFANPGRKIETMIETCDYLDSRFELHLFLVKSDSANYYDKLVSLIESRKNVFLHEPVSSYKLLDVLNRDYDIGMFICEPTTFNLKYTLPNKSFEFIQARLMTAISPAKGMMPLVEKYDLGVISADHTASSMAESLNRLNRSDIDYYKGQADKAAHAVSIENYFSVIVKEVNKYVK